MKILVTGGAGFIGSHTVVELIEAGHTAVIVDDFSNSKKWIVDRIIEITGKAPVVYVGNCNDKVFLSQVFEKEKNIDGVIHFAAFKAVGESIQKPLLYYSNNLNSLIVLLGVMHEHKTPHLVFSSSATVYGTPNSNPIRENAEIKEAQSPYGNTKIICEQIIHDTIKSGAPLGAVALRYFNPIGAHPSGLIGELPLGVPNNLVPYLTQVAVGVRKKLVVHGNDYHTHDGTCMRDFIHVVDLARAHIATLEYLKKQSNPFFDIFNVGTGKGRSVLELINTFQKVNGVPLHYEFGPRRSGDIECCYAEVDKIRKTLGWQALKTIDDALIDAWRWQKNNP